MPAFQWDPMITTLPGLYVLSVGSIKLLSVIINTSVISLCSVTVLRTGNVLLLLGNIYLIYKLINKSHPSESIDRGTILKAITMATLPVLYLTSFFYYTDTASTFFVLHMYLLASHGSHLLASFVGILSVVIRQTNIIWVAFVCALTAADCLLRHIRLGKKDIDINGTSDWKMLTTVVYHVALLSKNLNSLFAFLIDVISQIWSYVIVGLFFVAFVVWNDGVVVGDRTHHIACFNIPQIFYFLSFSLVHSLPLFLDVNTAKRFWTFLRRGYMKIALFCAASLYFIHRFTYVHEYVLADNRHYTFYIWSKIYRRHYLVKYMLVPVYGASFWLHCDLVRHRNILWKLILAVSLLLSTVPQRLLEFRYFIIPYLIFLINARSAKFFQQALQFGLFFIVNFATILLFLFNPFKWDNSVELQRFVW